jgi:3-oxoacyl-[acyl-carrier protein] reductase
MTAEWAPSGIRINAVAPGTIITPRVPKMAEDPSVSKVPLQRRGVTDDIAKAVLFFMSDLSSYVTGQTLAVDGGVCAIGPMDYAESMAKIGRGGTMGMSAKA